MLMRQGAYEAQYISLTGVSQSYLEQLNLGEGRIPASGEMGMVLEMVYSSVLPMRKQAKVTGIQENCLMWILWENRSL